jgi:hypothetical protein
LKKSTPRPCQPVIWRSAFWANTYCDMCSGQGTIRMISVEGIWTEMSICHGKKEWGNSFRAESQNCILMEWGNRGLGMKCTEIRSSCVVK